MNRRGLTTLLAAAALALLPFLPMSPVDVRLILRGLRHGKLVQFDRSDHSGVVAASGAARVTPPVRIAAASARIPSVPQQKTYQNPY